MRTCELRDAYLDGGMTPPDALAFEAHLFSCPACREQVAEWRMFERGVQRWGETRRATPVTTAAAAALVRLAENGRRRGLSAAGPGTKVAWAGAVVLATLLAVVVLLRVGEPESVPPDAPAPSSLLVMVLGPSGAAIPLSEGAVLEAPTAHHVKAAIGKDTVAVSANGRVRILSAAERRVRLGLERGTVACRVDKRQGTADFVVDAGEYTVRVVGTRFSVTRSDAEVRVLVTEGAVNVASSRGETWTLRAGETFTEEAGTPVVRRASPDAFAEMDGMFDEPEAPAEAAPIRSTSGPYSTLEAARADDAEGAASDGQGLSGEGGPSPARRREAKTRTANLPLWRSAVLAGRQRTVIPAMKRHLRESPDDHRTWSLLADASRKMGDFDQAVRAYEKVVALGRGPEVGRAMFMLASLLQAPLARHREALEMFEAYQASDHVTPNLSGLADVRIARSLVALGRCEEAGKRVSHLMAHGDPVVAENTRKMLSGCDSGASGGE